MERETPSLRVTFREEAVRNGWKWLQSEKIVITAVDLLATGRRDRKKIFFFFFSFQFSV